MLEMFLKMLPPDTMEAFRQAPQFMDAWTKFMLHLRERLSYGESRLETIDNKLSYVVSRVDEANERLVLIMSETNLTPVIHTAALAMAAADPRNMEAGS